MPWLIRGRVPRSVGVFVHAMPVTTREARDLDRAVWGFAKFVADMSFVEGPDTRGVTLSEAGEDILALDVAVHGRGRIERDVAVLYSTLEGHLLRTECPTLAYVRRRWRAAGHLRLGSHPLGVELRGLRLGKRPFATRTALWQRLSLPAGVRVAPATDHRGPVGVDRERGRYALSTAEGVVDLYQPLADVSAVSGAWQATDDATRHSALREH
jgi:hypothetical protein